MQLRVGIETEILKQREEPEKARKDIGKATTRWSVRKLQKILRGTYARGDVNMVLCATRRRL